MMFTSSIALNVYYCETYHAKITRTYSRHEPECGCTRQSVDIFC